MVKLAKYLPHHGVRPAVLTAANPSVPLLDPSLLRDVPEGIEVTRVRTLEPEYAAKRAAWRTMAADSSRDTPVRPARAAGTLRTRFRTRVTSSLAGAARHALFPDAQILWQPAAQAALGMRLAARRDDVILVSGPPFSQFLLAPLARAGGLGVVLDYRDEWSTLRSTYEMARSPVSRVLGDPVEATVLRLAHAIVTATEEFRTNLLERFPFVDPSRVFAIPNGYDRDDFPHVLPEPGGDRLVITYAGTVFALTSARGLLGAVRLLSARSPALARLLRLRFLGRVVDTERDAFADAEALGVEQVGYVPHAEVVLELAASHMTLCLLDDVAGAERIYPAKIFELMHLGRPVFTLAPPRSALARLVQRHQLGPLQHPRDEAAIATAVETHLRAFQRGDNPARPWRTRAGIERYDRRALAGEFAEILREAASSARRSRSWPVS